MLTDKKQLIDIKKRRHSNQVIFKESLQLVRYLKMLQRGYAVTIAILYSKRVCFGFNVTSLTSDCNSLK